MTELVITAWWCAFEDGSVGVYLERPENAVYAEPLYRKLEDD